MRYGTDCGSFQLVDMPGSPQIAVSIHTFVLPELRGKGYGDKDHKLRLAELQRLGYNYALCTVNARNAVEVHILEKNGWDRLSEFVSSSTGNTVRLYGKHIVRQEKQS